MRNIKINNLLKKFIIYKNYFSKKKKKKKKKNKNIRFLQVILNNIIKIKIHLLMDG